MHDGTRWALGGNKMNNDNRKARWTRTAACSAMLSISVSALALSQSDALATGTGNETGQLRHASLPPSMDAVPPVRMTQATGPIAFKIPVQNLDNALQRYAALGSIQVIYDANITEGLQSRDVSGTFSREEALRKMLEGTGLTPRFNDSRSVTILAQANTGTASDAALPTVVVQDQGESTGEGTAAESAYGPVDGYLAERSATATKTDTAIRDIPNSIQVIPRDIILDQQAINLEEVLDNAAGVTFLGNDGNRNLNFAIRGFDNAPILRNGFNLFAFGSTPAEVEVANLERAEVVRGPSVLYGRTEPGGAINLVTKKPLDTPYYNVELQVGDRGLISPIVDLSGPFSEDGSLLYRVVALYREEDSFQDYDDSFNRTFVAPSVTWRPGSNTDVTFRLEYTRDDDPYISGIPAIGDRIADIPFDRVINNPDDTIDQTSFIASYELEHRFSDALKLRNQLAWVYGSYEYSVFALPIGLDDSTGDVDRIFATQFNDTRTLTTDTSLQAKLSTGNIDHTVLVGVDYARSSERSDTNASFDPPFPSINIFDPDYFAVPKPAKSDLPFLFGNKSTGKQLGFYGQDQIAILDNLFLVAGVRYDRFSSESDDFDVDFGTSNTEFDVTAWTPRAGVLFRPFEPISLYANYSESFQPNSSFDASGNVLPPEEGEGVEAGVKIEFIPDRLSSTLAFFDITKQNVATPDPNNPFFSVAVGEQRSRGFDVDLTGEIRPGWSIVASYAYIDTEVTEDNNVAIVGNEFFGIPRHSASLWTTYVIQSGRFEGLGGGIGFNYVGDRQGDLANSFEVDDYFVVNAGVSYRWRNWQARLNFENIFDVDYIKSAEGLRLDGSLPGAPFTVRGLIAKTF